MRIMIRDYKYICGIITDVSDSSMNVVLEVEPAETVKIDLCFLTDRSIAKVKSKIGSSSIVRAAYTVDLFGNKKLYCKSIKFLG